MKEEYESLQRKLAIHLHDVLPFKYIHVNEILKIHGSSIYVIDIEMSNRNKLRRILRTGRKVKFIITPENINKNYNSDLDWDANFCKTAATMLKSGKK